MTLKLLVTGAAGLLGSRVAYLASRSFQTTAAYHLSQQNLPLGCQRSVKIDLCDENSVLALLHDSKLNLIINCAGASNVDRCETNPEYASNGNFLTALNLAKAASKSDARLLHISTDYIFDGKSGPSTEAATPSPINYYGKTKLMAELAIQESGAIFTIVRICSLYSKDLSARPNPFNGVVNSLRNAAPYLAVDDFYSNPTEVADLAAALCQLAQRSTLPSILHLAAPTHQSRYEFAIQVATRMSLDPSLIKRISLADLNLPAPRPRQAGLTSALLHNFLTTPLSLSSLSELKIP